MPEDWLSTQEASELSGYQLQYVRRLIRKGQLDARKFGPLWQVSRESLIAYLEAAESKQDKRWGPKK